MPTIHINRCTSLYFFLFFVSISRFVVVFFPALRLQLWCILNVVICKTMWFIHFSSLVSSMLHRFICTNRIVQYLGCYIWCWCAYNVSSVNFSRIEAMSMALACVLLFFKSMYAQVHLCAVFFSIFKLNQKIKLHTKIHNL